MPLEPTLRAEVQAFSTKQGVENTFVEAARAEGRLGGQSVLELDVNSSLANAAEEATFAASETVEKKLSERKAASKESLRASATELAGQFVNMMAEPQAARKLHEFMDAMKKMGENASGADLRRLVGEYFEDSSQQFAALSLAEDALARSGDRAPLLAKVREAKAQLLHDAGPAIRSGLNIAADVIAYAKSGLEGAEALRDLYRFTVLGGQSIVGIYTKIMDRYGPAQFSLSLDFLLRAAASDLEGKLLGSSLEPTRLKDAVDDIYHVQALGNLHRSLGDVLDQTRRLFAS